ncbi:MAG: dienelactone hydrolase family protein [Rhodospirillaceae bacterium]|nr:dienelactone hydrolase family protein [Rhodospirillaceae bacterium]
MVAAGEATLTLTPTSTTETVDYVSFTVGTFSKDFASADTVNLSGELHLPAGKGPFPVVVWQHGSGPANSNTLRQWRKDLRFALSEKRIGLFVADSYSGRGIKSTGRDQRKLSGSSRVVDVFKALEALAAHPKVDGNRIGISGNSFGGIISFRSSYETYAARILPDGLRYAAHAPFYPACQTRYSEYVSTGAPMLFLLGEADDYTPAGPCVEQVKLLKEAGVDAEVVVYTGAHHGFISSRSVRYKPMNQTFKGCGVRYLTPDGHIRTDYGSSEDMPYKTLIRKLIDTCVTRGVHVGRNSAAAKDALKRIVAFFSDKLVNG